MRGRNLALGGAEMAPGSVALAVRDLHKNYESDTGRVAAMRGIDFDVHEGEFFTLLGPSGCGKTTTLRCLAGLERPDRGMIRIQSETVFSSEQNLFVPPHRRAIGMVFQSYAIWPHMNVFGNVAFPLRNQRPRLSRDEIARRVREALRKVQLEGLERRSAPQLSGGQQQRLALARALVKEPRLLLLDEPLSNLDAKLREEMRAELRALVRRLGITTVFVTHDQMEALAMSDRIAILRDGELVQVGAPADLYTRPRNRFVAEFVGIDNFFAGAVAGRSGDGIHTLETGCGPLLCHAPSELPLGSRALVAVRPENIQVVEGDEGPNRLRGVVRQCAFAGEFLDCRVQVGQQVIHLKTNPLNAARVREGEGVTLHLPPAACFLIPEESGEAAVMQTRGA